MKGKSSDDIFINRLLEETYRSMPENEMSKASKDLLDYFNDQKASIAEDSAIDTVLLNYIQQNGLNYLVLNQKDDIECFEVETMVGQIHLPYNWSFFSELKNSEDNHLHYVNKTNDSELLLEVLNLYNFSEYDLVFVKYEDQYLMVYLPEGKQGSYNWFKNFLGLNRQTELKAA